MGGGAGLRIAYSNQKQENKFFKNPYIFVQSLKQCLLYVVYILFLFCFRSGTYKFYFILSFKSVHFFAFVQKCPFFCLCFFTFDIKNDRSTTLQLVFRFETVDIPRHRQRFYSSHF